MGVNKKKIVTLLKCQRQVKEKKNNGNVSKNEKIKKQGTRSWDSNKFKIKYQKKKKKNLTELSNNRVAMVAMKRNK